MTCPSEDLFVGLLQDTLDPEERQALDAHIDQCAACAELMAELAHLLLSTGIPQTKLPDPNNDKPPARFGDFEPIRILGQGGMGVVYLAEHVDTGQRVALKTLKGIDARLMHSMRREIQTLKALQHPCVVRVLDDGVMAGVPWYTMTWIEGVTLRSMMDTALSPQTPAQELNTDPTLRAGVPLPLGQVLRGPTPAPLRQDLLGWLAQICHALAWIHGEGVVHCDLKPSNILISGQKRAILVDFGIASQKTNRLSPRALLTAGAIDGTALYMAPERIVQQPFDARADLYALGCILYETLAGRPPFLGPTVQSVLDQHVRDAPPPLSKWGVQAPKALEDVVMGLLSKRPESRPGHANIPLGTLRTLGIDAHFDSSPPPARPYLYTPKMMGRETASSVLDEHMTQALSGHGRAVMLLGESGIGKTRMGVSVVERARVARMRVLFGQCDRSGADSARKARPLHAFEEVLRGLADRCREEGQETTERIFGARGPILAPFAPFIEALPGQDRHPSPPEISPGAARQRVCSAVVDAIDAAANGEPLLVVFDDLQWADELSVAGLEALAKRAAQDKAWMLLGTSRTEEMGTSLRRFIDRGGASVVDLGQLDGEAMASVMAQMLGMSRTPDFMDQLIYKQTRGNPFFVAEYMQLLVQLGQLKMDPRGRWSVANSDTQAKAGMKDLPVPGSIRALVESRLEGIDGDAKALLEAAAVLGRRMTTALLTDVAKMEEPVFEAALVRLRRMKILDFLDSGALHFIHDQLLDAAYARISEAPRERLHLRAARRLSQRDRQDHEQIARHWERGGEPEPAREAWLKAAQHALDRYSPDIAETHFRSALALFEEPAKDKTALNALTTLAEKVVLWQGRNDEVLGMLDALDDDALPPDILAHKAYIQGRVYAYKGQIEAARAAFSLAHDILAELGDLTSQSTMLSSLASLKQLEGKLDEALELKLESLALRRQVNDRRNIASSLSDIGLARYKMGQYEASLEDFRASIVQSWETGNPYGVAAALNNLALSHEALGRHHDSLRAQEQARQVSATIGHPHSEAVIVLNLGTRFVRVGRLAEGRDHYEEALLNAQRLDMRAVVGATHSKLAALLGHQGLTDDAQKHARKAIELFTDIAQPARLLTAYAALAAIYLDMRRLDDAEHLGIEATRACHQALAKPALRSDLVFELARTAFLAGQWAHCTHHLDVLGPPDTLSASLAMRTRLLRASLDGFLGHTARAEAAIRQEARRDPEGTPPFDRLRALLLHGHALLSIDSDPQETLREARHLLDAMAIEAPARMALDTEVLERAHDRWQRGQSLIAGFAPDDLPPKIRDIAHHAS